MTVEVVRGLGMNSWVYHELGGLQLGVQFGSERSTPCLPVADEAFLHYWMNCVQTAMLGAVSALDCRWQLRPHYCR
jgi:hypothetical protein